MYRDIPQELRTLIEPIVEAHGLELVDAELVRGRGPWELRVTVDTPSGDGKVSACPLPSYRSVFRGLIRERPSHQP